MKIGDKVVWIPDNAKGEVKELFDEFNQVKYLAIVWKDGQITNLTDMAAMKNVEEAEYDSPYLLHGEELERAVAARKRGDRH